MQAVRILTVLDGVSTTGSSTSMYIGDFDRVAVLLRAASISSGNGVFKARAGFGVLASDTPTMTLYNQLIDNVVTTNAQTQTHVNTKTLSANGDVLLWVDNNAPATHLSIDVTRTTDGVYSAYIIGFNQVQS